MNDNSIIVHHKRNIFSPGNCLVIVGVAVLVDKHLADDLVYLAVEEVADGLEHPARQLAERVARKRLSIGNVRAEKLEFIIYQLDVEALTLYVQIRRVSNVPL